MGFRQNQKAGAQKVVSNTEFWKQIFCIPNEETPQGARVGNMRKAGEILENPVGAKKCGQLNLVESEDHRIEQREHAFGNAEMIVTLRRIQLSRKKSADLQLLEKTV